MNIAHEAAHEVATKIVTEHLCSRCSAWLSGRCMIGIENCKAVSPIEAIVCKYAADEIRATAAEMKSMCYSKGTVNEIRRHADMLATKARRL